MMSDAPPVGLSGIVRGGWLDTTREIWIMEVVSGLRGTRYRVGLHWTLMDGNGAPAPGTPVSVAGHHERGLLIARAISTPPTN